MEFCESCAVELSCGHFGRGEERETYGGDAMEISHNTVWLGSKGFIGFGGS